MRAAHFDVQDFCRAVGAMAPPVPTWPSNDTLRLRIDLISEETKELLEAIADRDLVETADAIVDLAYVVIGMGHVMGLPMAELWEEVHVSNMTKLGPDGKPVLREDGKATKGPNYVPPDLRSILLAAGWVPPVVTP